MAYFNGNIVLTGNNVYNKTVTTDTITSSNFNTSSRYIVANSAFSTASSSQTTGFVDIYATTSTQNTVASGGFSSTTTVVTNNATTFATNDIILITGAANNNNNGLFEVASYTSGTITIRSSPVEDFTKNIFTSDSTVSGTITKVFVGVTRVNGSGLLQFGKGSVTALSFASVTPGDYTRTVVNTSTYTALSSDDIIAVTYTTTGICTISLPGASSKKRFIIVDEGGNAGTNNIVIVPNGADTIIGSASFNIDINYGSITIYNDSSAAWFISN